MERQEVAPGVVRLALGRGWRAVNAYVVQVGAGHVLIDAGWKGDAREIIEGVEAAAGPGASPAAVLLTHVHPDHSGAARELARRWKCRVSVHPREVPIACGDVDALWSGTGPLDRRLILPAMRALGRRRMADLLARESLEEVLHVLEAGAEPPGLPGWRVLQTPGHTPGHVAFWRPEDGLLITGDALATVELNSPAGVALGSRRISNGPWITTWDWTTARASARALVALEPSVLAGGHGEPMSGEALQAALARYRRRHALSA